MFATVLLGLLAFSALLVDARFNYSDPCGASATTSVKKGDTAFLCIHINGHVTAVFTPIVDSFYAVNLLGCEYEQLALSVALGPWPTAIFAEVSQRTRPKETDWAPFQSR